MKRTDAWNVDQTLQEHERFLKNALYTLAYHEIHSPMTFGESMARFKSLNVLRDVCTE